MDLLFVIQLVKAVIKELWLHKYAAVAVSLLIAFASMGYGAMWQEKYEVSTTIYADDQNIIQPLLAGQAAVTSVEDRRQIVRDVMLSQRILEKIVAEEGFLDGTENAAAIAAKVSGLRNRVGVRMLGPNYIGVSFTDANPERAYNVVTSLVDYFIKESSESKRSESKQAFLFIDKQANAYKEQLRQAEERLKTFQANNIDGTEARVTGQIESLRSNVNDLELDLAQAEARVESFEAQVSEENQYLARKARADDYRERIAEAVNQLDTMLLSLTENHPDVINLRQHIAGLEEAAEQEGGTLRASGSAENPVFDELRSQLANARVEKNTIENRLGAMRKRLEEEFARAKRVAEKNAELSELTRDYDVTQQLYEELLERKEKARLSMTLDIEGQGVTYKIQEPAKYPLTPSGLHFIHFVFVGAILAVLVPIGLAVVYVLVDPRIRFTSNLESDFDLPLLGVVPQLASTQVKYARKADLKIMGTIILASLLLYFGMAGFITLWN